jgi:hypothetical protein
MLCSGSGRIHVPMLEYKSRSQTYGTWEPDVARLP